MRPLGRRERQRRNLPCRASPAGCCQERRESPSRPCHNFLAGRHPWLGPLHSRLQRVVIGQIECCLGKSATFACDFPPIGFLDSESGNAARMPEWSVSRNLRKWFKTKAFTQIEGKY